MRHRTRPRRHHRRSQRRQTVAVRAALAALDPTRHTIIGACGIHRAIVAALGGPRPTHRTALHPQPDDRHRHRRLRQTPPRTRRPHRHPSSPTTPPPSSTKPAAACPAPPSPKSRQNEHHHDTLNTKPCPPTADRASPRRSTLTSNDAYMLTANVAQQPAGLSTPAPRSAGPATTASRSTLPALAEPRSMMSRPWRQASDVRSRSMPTLPVLLSAAARPLSPAPSSTGVPSGRQNSAWVRCRVPEEAPGPLAHPTAGSLPSARPSQ